MERSPSLDDPDGVVLDVLSGDVHPGGVPIRTAADLPALADLERPETLVLPYESAGLIVDWTWVRRDVLV